MLALKVGAIVFRFLVHIDAKILQKNNKNKISICITIRKILVKQVTSSETHGTSFKV